MLSIYVIITAIYLILAVCDAIIGIGFAKHSGPLKLGILTTLIDLFFTLTLLTYASNRYEEPSYGLSALFFILSYLIEIINLFVNKNPLLSDETTLAEVCSGGATLIGCICSISNLKDRFRGAWFLFIAMVLMAMFGGIGKTEQTIDFFSILSAILGLIFIISIYIVGDRKRFLQEFEREYDDFYDYTYESTPLSSTTDASIQAASGQREDLDENLDELGQKSHKNIWWLVAVGVVVVGVIVAVIIASTAKSIDDDNFSFFNNAIDSAAAADSAIESVDDHDDSSFAEPFYPPVYDGDFNSSLADANWVSTGKGFSVPSVMKKTKDDFGVLVYSFGPVDICYEVMTYRGALGNFPDVSHVLANGSTIESITYSAPKHSIYSGYLTDGRVYYMKVGAEDMLEESHEIGDDIYIGGLYAMPYLTAVYPKSYEKACEKIIKMVMKWNG